MSVLQMAGFADLYDSAEFSDVILHLSADIADTAAKIGTKKRKMRSTATCRKRTKGKQQPDQPEYVRSFHCHAVILCQSDYFKVSIHGLRKIHGYVLREIYTINLSDQALKYVHGTRLCQSASSCQHLYATGPASAVEASVSYRCLFSTIKKGESGACSGGRGGGF